MKKALIVVMAVLMAVSFSSMALAVGTGNGLSDAASPHNFSAAAWNTTGEICVVCHTPHFAQVANGILWNRTLSTQTYTMYNSATLDGAYDVSGQPTGKSKLCLSCHDGTVALDSFGATPTTTTTIASAFDVDGTTGSLESTHPISIVYDDVNDYGLNVASVTIMGGGYIDTYLEAGVLQCSTCHDVHDADPVMNGTALLRVPNNNSALCLTCHAK